MVKPLTVFSIHGRTDPGNGVRLPCDGLVLSSRPLGGHGTSEACPYRLSEVGRTGLGPPTFPPAWAALRRGA